MIARPYVETDVYGGFSGYPAWKVKAATALGDAITARGAGLAHDFDGAVWKALKDALLDYFWGKCAYCETNVRAGFWGDVEHYRPKKKVEEDAAHPGYYWLAYDPSNLMPSCQRCNQGGAKMNHFPVAGARASGPADSLDAEEPLLLNPYTDKPAEHLAYEFDPATGRPNGYLSHKTERGRVSIETYNLNRADLCDERQRAQEESITEFLVALLSKRSISEVIAKLRAGVLPYSGARLAAVFGRLESIKAEMADA